MKSSKIISGVAGLALMVTFGSSAFGLTVTFNRYAGYYSTSGGQPGGVGGGEFSISGAPELTANYDSKAVVNGGFESFCLEYLEHIGVPATYNAAVGPGAISGGGGTVPLAGGGTIDYISMGTALLYSQFAAGNLAGYNYTGARATSAGALQAAFWFLEEEISLSDAEIAANIFLKSLGIDENRDSDVALQRANSGGLYDVAVLNVGSYPDYPKQDQLVISRSGLSVPDGGTTLLLMGVALGGVSMLRRKLA